MTPYRQNAAPPARRRSWWRRLRCALGVHETATDAQPLFGENALIVGAVVTRTCVHCDLREERRFPMRARPWAPPPDPDVRPGRPRPPPTSFPDHGESGPQ